MVALQGGGLSPSIEGGDLVAAIPQVSAVADIDVVTPFLIPGASLSYVQVAEVSSSPTSSVPTVRR
jgi:L-asparaginase